MYEMSRTRSRGNRSPSPAATGPTIVAGRSWANATRPASAAPPRSYAYTRIAIHVAHSPTLNPAYAATTRRRPRFAATAAKPSSDRRNRPGSACADIAASIAHGRGRAGPDPGTLRRCEPGSVLPIESARTKQEPRQAPGESLRPTGRMDRSRMELLDDRSEPGGK